MRRGIKNAQLEKELEELKQKQIETARKLKLRGLQLIEISELTGLSVEEIEKL
jgi:DNA-directed RNA polymerase specialized sigma24 family protein